jgi:seryl-tRNA synthetase
MLDIKWIREKPQALIDALVKRQWSEEEARSTVDDVILKDETRRAHLGELQVKQERRNTASKEIGNAMRNKDMALAETLKEEVNGIKAFLAEAEETERKNDKALEDALAVLPNVPLDDVPIGADEHGNVELRKVGAVRPRPNWAKEHFEIGEALGLMDFERAAKLSGARFTILKGQLARLERALGQFMLDLHTTEHGYIEVQVPLVVNSATMYGTGQLPKFSEDLYAILNEFEILKAKFESRKAANDLLGREHHWLEKFNSKFDELMRAQIKRGVDVGWTADLFRDLAAHFRDYSTEFNENASEFGNISDRFLGLAANNISSQWLIPTAEVPLTNLVRQEILKHDQLPLRYTALTPCFRSEAGSAGRDTRGMLRQHQFYKVELVSITDQQNSLAEHERMTQCAEEVLKRLGLPFRTITLCTGDMGFGAQKTYDIEVWLPGQNAFREISSCSVCGDFQARRMDARYRPKDEKATRFVHTLNGSGVAVGRALIAVIENYQNQDGSVSIPEALRPYMGGLERIGA